MAATHAPRGASYAFPLADPCLIAKQSLLNVNVVSKDDTVVAVVRVQAQVCVCLPNPSNASKRLSHTPSPHNYSQSLIVGDDQAEIIEL